MARVVVFAPSPLLTITVEQRGGHDDIHLHAGGQGVWVARMLRCLEVDVIVCSSFGGEIGQVVRALLLDEGLVLRAIAADASNAAYVHDRRTGVREEVADMPSPPLARHELDELYGVVLAEGLDAQACVLGGPATPGTVPAEAYERLAADLTENGTPVLADLTGEPLKAVLAGGVRMLKVSDEEMVGEGRADDSERDLIAALARLRASGARDVIISRGADPALALLGDSVVELVIPQLHAVDERGAGDSMTAGIAAGIAEGMPIEEAVRLGGAAGALNVTRRGLGTGNRSEIEQLAAHVELRPLGTHGEAPGRRDTPDELASRARRS